MENNKRVIKHEGLNLNIDKEVLDDQRILEVSTEVPENAKVDNETKIDFENYKILYKGAIDDKCLNDYGTLDNDKLWEDTAKEMFLQTKLYIPEDDKKVDGELVEKETKTESKKVINHNRIKTESKEDVVFNSIEFEKTIPHVMRFKQWDVINDNDLYWVTQQFFREEDVKEFAEKFKDTPFDNAYVTVRDLSTYDYNIDRENNVLVNIKSDGSYDMTDYIDTCKKENYDESLYESKKTEEKITLDDKEKKLLKNKMIEILKNHSMFDDETKLNEFVEEMMPMWIELQQNSGEHIRENKKLNEVLDVEELNDIYNYLSEMQEHIDNVYTNWTFISPETREKLDNLFNEGYSISYCLRWLESAVSDLLQDWNNTKQELNENRELIENKKFKVSTPFGDIDVEAENKEDAENKVKAAFTDSYKDKIKVVETKECSKQ